MSLTSTTKYLERNRFFNGQRLFASDLQALEQFNRELRWLHNRTLHQPGIGSGLAASGQKGDRRVSVQPGYAVDALGRELILNEAVVEAVPPVADDGFGGPVFFDLVLSYPDESVLGVSEDRAGVCTARGAVRLREAPIVCWIQLGPAPDRLPLEAGLRGDVEQGKRIRLGRAQVLNCQLDRPLSLAQRRSARPAEQPYIASAKALGSGPKAIVWSASADSGFGLALSTSVDTSAAGFRTEPHYVAHVLGDRLFSYNASGDSVRWLLDGFPTLQSRPSGFDFSLLVPEVLLGESRRTAEELLADQAFRAKLLGFLSDAWTLEWLGVEG